LPIAANRSPAPPSFCQFDISPVRRRAILHNRLVRPPVSIYNPLPSALHHYQTALVDVLSSCGIETRSAGAPSVELHGNSTSQRAQAALADLGAHLKAARRGGHVIVCWPTYGLVEPLLWLASWRRSTVSVIVHDPTPLRPQIGMGRTARVVGGLAGRTRTVDVVVHSQVASSELQAMGWTRPKVLPHPVCRPLPRPDEPGDARTVLVCGQYKPARDLDLLVSLAPLLRDRGFRLLVVGRGWPDIAGWEVDDRFLPESELDQRIGRSAAVLIPYSRFYQSGIAVRALELGAPVVGPRHPFLIDLFGDQWPGLISAGHGAAAWAEGLALVTRSSAGLTARSAVFRERCEREWADYLRRLGIPPAVTRHSSTPK
jgi:glycosyltransferase involved in cell wall biosynthesis